MPKKNNFPKVDFEDVVYAHIGLGSRESVKGYLTRISTPKHDDSKHPFTSSKSIPGICACGWIHPDLMCNDPDCEISIQDHVRFAVELLSGDLFVEIVVMISE